ncbi:RtcB family protein [Lentisphaerota bacterium WC36G]|nr:RtcB family protein [Lentisphaerae bacterium WC36]
MESLYLTAYKLKIDKAYKALLKFYTVGLIIKQINNELIHYNLPENYFQSTLGTIGSDNHFLELQSIEKVCDNTLFDKLNLSRKNMFMMIYCGSQSLGSMVLREYTDQFVSQGIDTDNEIGKKLP